MQWRLARNRRDDQPRAALRSSPSQELFLPIALLVIGDAATRRITEYGWRNELSPVFSKEGLVNCAGEALAGRAAVLASARFTTGFEAAGQIYFLELGGLLATSTLSADLASTHACVTRFGIGRAFPEGGGAAEIGPEIRLRSG